ncbi:MAG: sigma 54-interacting transcriptional regulator [Planctomycetota bacterium]|nr:sigma 54-interacting transcriptional regulator [Planctomycetota bacterium]
MSALDLGPRYHYLRELGSGGMGRVLLVHDRHLGSDLAFKLFHDARAAGEMERFQREFALLTELEHPGIARAYDFGYLDDRPFFTSEYVPGEDLSCSLPKKPAELLGRALDIAEALDFLHRRGILHLDVKPSNIISKVAPSAARRPENGRAVLIDFGLFRRGFPVRPGARLKGSLPFMAPEFVRQQSLGPWTDVYAFGVTLYVLATGRLPRCGATGSGATREIEEPAPEPPSRYSPEIPKDLDGVILKCLALGPESRFASAGEVLDSLRRIDGVSGRPPRPRAASGSTVGRREELRQLDDFLTSIRQGAGESGATAASPVLLVSGPPGTGQTHLLKEMKKRAQMSGLRFCLETGYAGRPPPPGSVLRDLGAFMKADSAGARRRWQTFLTRLRRPRASLRDEVLEDERRLRRAGELTRAVSFVREPSVLAVDGLQFWDEISVELLTALVRYLSERRPPERPPIGLVLAYREEGPVVKLLGELSEYVLGQGKGDVLSLRPLGVRETLELHRNSGGTVLEGAGRLSVFQETGGSPARVLALAAAGEDRASRRTEGRDVGDTEERLRGLTGDSRRILLTLCLFRRPSSTAELSRTTGISRGRLDRQLRDLARSRLVTTVDSSSGRQEWVAGPTAGGLLDEARLSERTELHRRIARELCRTGRVPEARLVEAVHHCRMAGSGGAVVRHGIPAARYLKATYQNRAALEVYRSVLEAVPESRRNLRVQVTFEMAEVLGRLGNLRDGIDILKGMLRHMRMSMKSFPASQRIRVVLLVATLYSRSGEFRRADSHFREGFAELDRCPRALKPRDVLLYINERAALKVFVGEPDEARRLCEEGLRLARRSRGLRVREVVLNLYATRANVALRAFDYATAVRDFEKALEIAETIGSPSNRAVVLNNLGIVYAACDRYGDATRAFEEAERIGRPLDEGPSLVAIHGNLALVHAKRGDFAAVDETLAEAERLGPETFGRRQKMFLEHAKGVCLLYRGRYREARVCLEVAIELGEATGDRLVAAFDRLYRAEALIFEGSYAEAREELDALSDDAFPPRVRRMTWSRLALLEGLTGRADEVRRIQARHEELEVECPVPFLDAWSDVLLGWAVALVSLEGGSTEFDGDDVDDRELSGVRRALKYFEQRGAHPGTSLARWVLAEAYFLRGRTDRAQELLRPSRRDTDLTAVLKPLLRARIILDDVETPEDEARCADLLADAGAALTGNFLPEWALRIEALRAALRGVTDETEEEIEAKRKALARELPSRWRATYLENGHWKRWVPGELLQRRTLSREGDPNERTPVSVRTAPLGHRGGGPTRGDLVLKSESMQRLAESLDRLRGTDLPLLIRGEIGSGKEMVARIVHDESSRSEGPFLVPDCATIPEGLVEAELFGARSGAFTDLNEDRSGILALARGGTVFIDEIAELSPEVQAKLLRVLSEGTYRRLGDDREVRADSRFVFATSRDLDVELREGRVREDFLHRVRVLALRVPPLRERPEDIPDLVETFLREGRQPPPRLASGVLERLGEFRWPGNVRELRNYVARLTIEHPEYVPLEAVKRPGDGGDALPVVSPDFMARESLPELKNRVEREYLLYHFRRLHGDTLELSRFVGISRQHLYKRCRQLGIRLWRERQKIRGRDA